MSSFFLVDRFILWETLIIILAKIPLSARHIRGSTVLHILKLGIVDDTQVLIQTTSCWFMGLNLQTKQLGTVFRQVKGLRHQNSACFLKAFLLIKMKQSHPSKHSAHSWRCTVRTYFSITRLWIVQQFEHNWLALLSLFMWRALSGVLSYCPSIHFLDGAASFCSLVTCQSQNRQFSRAPTADSILQL